MGVTETPLFTELCAEFAVTFFYVAPRRALAVTVECNRTLKSARWPVVRHVGQNA